MSSRVVKAGDYGLNFDCHVLVEGGIDSDERFGVNGRYYVEICVQSSPISTVFVYTISNQQAPHYDPMNFAKIMEICGRRGVSVLASLDPYSLQSPDSQHNGKINVEIEAKARLKYENEETISLVLEIEGGVTIVNRWNLRIDPLNFVILATQMAAEGVDIYEQFRPGIVLDKSTHKAYYWDDEAPF